MSIAESHQNAFTHDLPPVPEFITEAHHPEFDWRQSLSDMPMTITPDNIVLEPITPIEPKRTDTGEEVLRPDLVAYRDKFPKFMDNLNMDQDALWLARIIRIMDTDAPLELGQCDYLFGMVQTNLREALEVATTPEQQQYYRNAMIQVHALSSYVNYQCRRPDGITVREATRDYVYELNDRHVELEPAQTETTEQQVRDLSFASREAFRSHRLGTSKGNRQFLENVVGALKVTPVDRSERYETATETLDHARRFRELAALTARAAEHLGIDFDRRGAREKDFWSLVRQGGGIAAQAALPEAHTSPYTPARQTLALNRGELL